MKYLPAMMTAAICLAAPLASAETRETPPKVVEIRIRGNDRLSRDAVLEHVRTRVGQNFNERVIREDTERLLRTGQFKYARAEKTQTPKGLVLTFLLAERLLVTKLALVGNKKFSDKKLSQELHFGTSDPLDHFNIEAGRRAILLKYREGGYHFATVTVDRHALARWQVIYRIVEGPLVRVRGIRGIKFEGNKHFSSFKLWRTTSTRSRLWCLPFNDGFLDTEELRRDVNKIRNLYISAGFLDARASRILTWSDDKKTVRVTFVIDEGLRYRINRIIFRGSEVFSDAELAKLALLEQGDFVKSEALHNDARRLGEAYGEVGHIETAVDTRTVFRDPDKPPPTWAKKLDKAELALADIVFEIREGNQFHVGRVNVRTESTYQHGDAITQSRVPRRELRLIPGRLYNAKASEESRRRLRNTSLFADAKITPFGTDADVRDALVQLTERQTLDFIIGVGVSTNTGVSGRVSLGERNFDYLAWPGSWRDVWRGHAFRGAGQTLRTTIEPGTEMSSLSANWFTPYINDQPYSLGLDGFMFTSYRESYDESRVGGAASVGHRFKNRWYTELSSGIENVKISRLDSDAPREVRKVKGTHTMYSPKITLVRDRTDSRWMPTTGDRFSTSLEQVLGDFHFQKLTANYRLYRTLHMDRLDRKHVLAMKLEAGQILGTAPVFEKFYGGGINSVRGFRYRGISPRSKPGDEAIGGDFLVFAGAEYGYPIAGEFLRGVLFIDTGSVDQDVEISKYRVSWGFGMRWIIPHMGDVPIRLDFGFPIVRDDKDKDQLLSFTLGWHY